MIPLVVSPSIREKLLRKHGVQELEVIECFFNHSGKYLIDSREDHITDPPTFWFIGETYRGRCLKIAFVHRNGNIYLKSAFDASEGAKREYAERNETGE